MAFWGSICPSETYLSAREGFVIRKLHVADSSIMHPYEIFLRSSMQAVTGQLHWQSLPSLPLQSIRRRR